MPRQSTPSQLRPGRAAAGAFGALALLIAGCYSFAEPSFHPGDARQVLVAMAAHGIRVESSVTGQSACDDAGLIGNALYLRGSVASDPVMRDIYLYTFKSNKWEGSQPAVDACQSQYDAQGDGATVTRLDIPTYRAFGADWSAELTRALRNALAQAATAGG